MLDVITTVGVKQWTRATWMIHIQNYIMLKIYSFNPESSFILFSWNDVKLVHFLKKYVPGEWTGDEEMDGWAVPHHYGHAAGLIFISQATGLLIPMLNLRPIVMHFLFSFGSVIQDLAVSLTSVRLHQIQQIDFVCLECYTVCQEFIVHLLKLTCKNDPGVMV